MSSNEDSPMPAVEWFRRQFSVGRYQIVVSAQLVDGKAVSTQTRWYPDIPRRLSPVLLKTYQQKRNRAYTALATRLGGAIVVADEFGTGSVALTTIYPDGRVEPLESRS